MGFTSSKLFLLILFALIMLTLIVQCVGMTLNHWWKTPEIDMMSRAVAHGGIWSACVVLLDFNGLASCFKYPYISNLEGNFIFEARHEISNNVVYAANKVSDQRSLIRAFASRLNIL